MRTDLNVGGMVLDPFDRTLVTCLVDPGSTPNSPHHLLEGPGGGSGFTHLELTTDLALKGTHFLGALSLENLYPHLYPFI